MYSFKERGSQRQPQQAKFRPDLAQQELGADRLQRLVGAPQRRAEALGG
jgi:hypothetical protein